MHLSSLTTQKKIASEPESHQFQERNRLAVGLVLAAGGGFMTAMYFGAFTQTAFTEIPKWLSALASVLATAISALAVYLVAKTLETAQETLETTREMALQQERVGNAQTRPYCLISAKQVNDLREQDDVYHVYVKLKNFGNTPATNVNVLFSLEGHRFEDLRHGKGPELISEKIVVCNGKHVSVVSQNGCSEFETGFHYRLFENEKFTNFSVSVDWSYQSHDGINPYTEHASIAL